MNCRNVVRSALALVATLMLCASAQAQLFRAYLSSAGNDANPCTLPSPCRLLPAALTAVASGGEIWMLDSANYNGAQVEVTKSVTILAIPGALGSVVSIGGGNGLNINTPGVKVTLRNLVIVQLGSGYFGVYFQQGAELNIEGCELANHPGMGGAVFVIAPTSKVAIKDSVLRNSNYGLYLSNSTVATLDRVRIENNGVAGIYVGNLARMTISNSVVSGNGIGMALYAGTGSNSQSVIDHTVVSGNPIGIDMSALGVSDVLQVTVAQSALTHSGSAIRLNQGAGANVTVIVDGSTLTNNTYAINFLGGTPTAYSRGNNTVKFNGLDFFGAGAAFTALAAQ